MARDTRPTANLRDACVEAAHEVIAEQGIEKLSLRDVARKLNVSHQAPYRHYPSRDHLLAEVIRRCFRRFTEALNARAPGPTPIDDMHALGASYLGYALAHPLEYRLMFGTPWPDVHTHPDIVQDARHSFNVLRTALAPLYGAEHAGDSRRVDADALFVWSSMHGLATILQSQVMDHLDLSEEVLLGAVGHIMQMVDKALFASAGQQTV
jgi:AcrR family transcriptional regulator